MIKHYSGFTLIELLIAVSIVALIAVMAAPAFSGFFERAQTRMIVDDLRKQLHFARLSATQYHQPIFICSSPEGIACHPSNNWSEKRLMVYTDNNQDNAFRAEDGDTLLHLTDKLPKDSFLIFKAFRNLSYIKFLPEGRTDSQNGHFTYCPPSGNLTLAKHLIVNISGEIRDGIDTDGDNIVENRHGVNITCS